MDIIKPSLVLILFSGAEKGTDMERGRGGGTEEGTDTNGKEGGTRDETKGGTRDETNGTETKKQRVGK